MASNVHPAWHFNSRPLSPVLIDKLAFLSSCAGHRQIKPAPDFFGAVCVTDSTRASNSGSFMANYYAPVTDADSSSRATSNCRNFNGDVLPSLIATNLCCLTKRRRVLSLTPSRSITVDLVNSESFIINSSGNRCLLPCRGNVSCDLPS